MQPKSAADTILIVDDPHDPRAVRSAPPPAPAKPAPPAKPVPFRAGVDQPNRIDAVQTVVTRREAEGRGRAKVVTHPAARPPSMSMAELVKRSSRNARRR